LGIANVEDRVIQKALVMVLELVYEQDFLAFSYGFRPGRSAHDALEALRKTIDRGKVQWVFEADIKGFFDNLNHEWLRKFVAHRIADRGIHRLIGKVLNAGHMEDGKQVRSEQGAPQGGPLSPLLANIYLHYVLDIWFERRFRRTCRGAVEIVRYADDFVVCFEHAEEADRFSREVVERFAAFGLELVPEKTRKIRFGTEQEEKGPGPGSGGHTFNFLGFTHYMRRLKRGLHTTRKPSQKSRLKFLGEVKAWLHKHMHHPPKLHQKVLSQKLIGFYGYFYLRNCQMALKHIRWHVEQIWYRVLGKRSQRAGKSWTWMKLRNWFRLPEPGERKSARRGERQENVGAKMRESIASVQLPLFPKPT
jgi:RNA-directed DNA polymerase